jgi:hypothetical protein
MAGVTMITNDEYKELILAQQRVEECEVALHQIAEELDLEKRWLSSLLLVITKGVKKSQWQDGKFEGFDLADNKEIAEYINAHFVRDGKLIVKEYDND